MVAAGCDEIGVRYGTHLVAAFITRAFGAEGAGLHAAPSGPPGGGPSPGGLVGRGSGGQCEKGAAELV